MRVASVQFEAGDRSKAENWARAEALVDGITGADLVLLPEIWNVGYFSFDRYAAEAEPLDGETVGRLRALARRHRCHLFGGSFVETSDRGLHNTSVLLDPAGELLAVYPKTWRPSPARGACSPPSPTAGCPSDGSRFLARPARLSQRGSRAIRGE